MPRKRKRNAGLNVKKKTIRYIKKEDQNKQNNIEFNMLNNCDVVTTNLDNISNDSNNISSDSNYNVTNDINSTKNTEIAAITVSDDDCGDEIEENVPTVLQDFNLELKVLKQMRKDSHRWSVFNLFVFKY